MLVCDKCKTPVYSGKYPCCPEYLKANFVELGDLQDADIEDTKPKDEAQ